MTLIMTPTQQIDEYISSVTDWRGKKLLELREIIEGVDSKLEVGWKWGVGVWSYQGKLVCAISAFKGFVKINFFDGAMLDDPKGIFNSGLDSKQHRSINYGESDKIDDKAIKKILRQSIDLKYTKLNNL
jgi:hypothetical protein